MILMLAVLAAVEWQSAVNPINDSLNELAVFFKIPRQEIKFIREDSGAVAQYELQLKVYDGRNEQVAGDFWTRERREDTIDIVDSIRLAIPLSARRFDLRIIDLEAYDIMLITDKIVPVKYLHDIRWFAANDTLRIRYQVANRGFGAQRLRISLAGSSVESDVREGVYPDSALIPVAGLPNGEYPLRFEIRAGGRTLEDFSRPVRINRPFFEDERTWSLKVSQLEYIATSAEITRLKNAPFEARDTLWKNFWAQYDPTPSTEINEREIEYFDRIAYCEVHFSHGDRGWRSDRAKVYIANGPPDEIQSLPYELGSLPYEVWFYYKLNTKYYFVDRSGVGEYILVNPHGTRI